MANKANALGQQKVPLVPRSAFLLPVISSEMLRHRVAMRRQAPPIS